MLIAPIDTRKQQEIIAEVDRYLLMAEGLYQCCFDMIDIRFDLKGKVAGMYKVTFGRGAQDFERVLRFNPWLFATYPDDIWCNTIPHEVAHYIVDCLHGFSNVRPHGKEWRAVMAAFGAEPLVRANYDLEGIPVRKVQRYSYRCDCREVLLSSQRHRKIQSLSAVYRCRDCGGILHLS